MPTLQGRKNILTLIITSFQFQAAIMDDWMASETTPGTPRERERETVTLYNLPQKKQRLDFETYFKTSTLSNIVEQNNLYQNLETNPPILANVYITLSFPKFAFTHSTDSNRHLYVRSVEAGPQKVDDLHV
jgi:hypothetical protein